MKSQGSMRLGREAGQVEEPVSVILEETNLVEGLVAIEDMFPNCFFLP